MTKLHQLRNGTWIELANVTMIVPGDREAKEGGPFVMVLVGGNLIKQYFNTNEGATVYANHLASLVNDAAKDETP